MKILLAITLVLSSFTANAMTGNEWLAQDSSARLYTVIGMADGLETMDEFQWFGCLTNAGVDCPYYFINPPPSGLTNGQIVRIFEKYLAEHPDETHLSAAKLLLDALLKVFPLKHFKP